MHFYHERDFLPNRRITDTYFVYINNWFEPGFFPAFLFHKTSKVTPQVPINRNGLRGCYLHIPFCIFDSSFGNAFPPPSSMKFSLQRF